MFRSRSPSQNDEITSSYQTGKASILRVQPHTPSSPPHSSDYKDSTRREYFNTTQLEDPRHYTVDGYDTPPLSEPEEVIDLQAGSPTSVSHSPPLSSDTLTIETMSAVIAAAVQMSTAGGAPSSLSLGHASIVSTGKKTMPSIESERPHTAMRRSFSSRLFTGSSAWKKQRSNSVNTDLARLSAEQCHSDASSQRSSASASPRSSASTARFTWLTANQTIPVAPPEVDSKQTMNRSTPVIDDGRDELAYRGIQIKEIKTTLKTMVIPNQVTRPMPEVKLERPGFVRINY
ncbi:uncharacterized protein BYT42DRAFT_566447 [Radiomyces spectabilis]|uniref:uncharacterized protein n=1 Tax=Radiomyces spectabilis TaxID=64574 RepID=UPI00221EDC5D|nr:uncharacterized protein BYT42DRAFT_566447 [Radiomyces spectabilis]KAI8381415.1 hypothetical protein BYT42DRAFT_566447 [Radiomyces spectabilis]